LLSVRLARLGEGGIDRSLVGHVAFAEHAADLRSDLLPLLLLQIEDRDLGALRRKCARSRFAEARGASGNHRGSVAADFHSCLPLPDPPRRRGFVQYFPEVPTTRDSPMNDV